MKLAPPPVCPRTRWKRLAVSLCALGVVLLCGVLVARVIGASAQHSGAHRALFLLGGAAACIAIAAIVRWLDFSCALPFSAPAKVSALAAVTPALWVDLGAPVPGVTVLALGAALAGFAIARRKQRLLGGGAQGAAAAVEPALLLILPWHVQRSRWLLAAGQAAVACAGIAAAFAIAPESGIASRLERLADPSPTRIVLVAAVLPFVLWLSWRRYPGRGLGCAPHEVALSLALTSLLIADAGIAGRAYLLPAAALGFEAWRLASSRRFRIAGSIAWLAALALLIAEPWTGEWTAWRPGVAGGWILVALSALPGFYPGTPELRAAGGACIR